MFYGVGGKYQMDEINQACIMMFVPSMLFIASMYTSFAHRRDHLDLHLPRIGKGLSAAGGLMAALMLYEYGLRFAFEPEDRRVTSILGLTYAEEEQTRDAYRDAGIGRAPIATILMVAAWGVGLITGPQVICQQLNPATSESRLLLKTFIVASILAGVSVCPGLPAPLSLYDFLSKSLAPSDGHFFKTLSYVTWASKSAGLWLKGGLAWCFRDDQHRRTEWIVHTYGDLAFALFILPFTAIFHGLLDGWAGYEDAFHHAALLSVVVGVAGSYIATIYMFKPMIKTTAFAHQYGLFAELRGKVPAEGDVMSNTTEGHVKNPIPDDGKPGVELGVCSTGGPPGGSV
uniref:Uncharacterized protein n=1 Tax=Octactis speculum TaxID=3111310 RepID=A0A6U3ZEI5_9STRA|mmetsp:Transcript_7577/g.9426  ORF Transcript_7577/g.9426 Transcript_7577/m.9426 type:complete len:344 (+) Transcript_7577:563-1594(+)